MELQKDQTYEFSYLRTYQTRNGVTFFEVSLDDETYNVYPKPFQLMNPPATLYCRVREIEENGYVKLTQDIDYVIESYFRKNGLYYFTVLCEDHKIESGQTIYKVNNAEVDLDFYYLEQEDNAHYPGELIKCRVSLKKDKDGKAKLRLYSTDRDMDGFLPEQIFAQIEHSEFYDDHFKNLVVSTDDLEDLFDEIVDKVENNNRLWVFDYIRLLKIQASLYSRSDLKKAIECNQLIIDFENWILESDFMSHFSPASRDENLLKAETTLHNAEIDIEAINLIIENKQIEFINELLTRLRAKKVIRKKQSVYRTLFKIINIDQNILEKQLKEVAEIIAITSAEVMDVEYLTMIINKFNWVVQEKKKQLNLSIHYQREKEVDNHQLLSLVICLGTLITIYQKEEYNTSDNKFNISLAFTDLCKYLAFLTTSEKANKLITKALAYTVSEKGNVKINGSKLVNIEDNVDPFVDSILELEIESPEDTLYCYNNDAQIQYIDNELLIIPTHKRIRTILKPRKVFNIPHTPLYICSINPNSEQWNNNADVNYYKDQWDTLLHWGENGEGNPKANQKVLVKVKKDNSQPWGIFCYINNGISIEDGLITKYDYLHNLVDCSNMLDFFEPGLNLPARIHYNQKNQINLSIREYLYKLSFSVAEDYGDNDFLAVCLKKSGKNAWFITEEGMIGRAKLKMTHSVKEGASYIARCNNEEYEVPGIDILGTSHEEKDTLELLREQLRILSRNCTDIDEYNGDAKALPRVLLIIDNYIRLINDDVARYNLYHIGRLISKAENSELANYYSARINYLDTLVSFTNNPQSALDSLESDEDISGRFPSLKEQTEVISLLRTLGVESEIEYLFAVANNDDKSSLITKISRLILAANLISSYDAPEHLTDSIRRFIISELGAYNSLQNISEPEEVIAEEIQESSVEHHYGIENQLQEFKTSIVYFAGDSSANTKEQFKVILRTITGFLNSKGGVLWIGVSDDGYASGIEPDLQYLDANTDKYERIIRQEIVKSLDKDINGTISFEFVKDAGKTICKIVIPPYFRPVSYNDEFYIRQGNETRAISGNSLIMFIERRLLDKKQNLAQQMPHQTFNVDEVIDIDSDPKDKERKVIDIDTDITAAGRLAQENTDIAYINMYIDGCYTITSIPIKDKRILFSEKIPTEDNNSMSLLLCYNNGCVNRMNIPSILCKKYNYRYSNGMYKNAELMKAFIVHDNDYICVICTAIDKKYIKVYPISEISDHTSLGLKGNQIISQNFHSIETWNIIEGKFVGHVEKLVYTSRSGIGKNINSEYYHEEISWLKRYFTGNRDFEEKRAPEISQQVDTEKTKLDILLKAINEKSKDGVKEFLKGCEGNEIHSYRDILIEVIQTKGIQGERFWFIVETLMEEMPNIFRRPFVSIAQGIKNTTQYQTSEETISKVCQLFLNDDSKISQSLEFFEPFKHLIPIGIKTKLINMVSSINTHKGFNTLFRILDSNDDQKVYILSLCRSNAAYYTLYDVLNKHEREYGKSSVKRIRNLEKILNALKETDEGKITYRLILKTIFHKEDVMKDSEVHQYLLGGFDTFNTTLTKLSQKKGHNAILKSIGDYLHTYVTVRVSHIYNDVAICNTQDGLRAILPTSYHSSSIQIGCVLRAYVTYIDFREKTMFLSSDNHVGYNKSDYNLVSIGDELEVRFSIFNNSARASVVGCGMLKADVKRYPRNFDFRKRYMAVVTDITSYNYCQIGNLKEIE